MSPDCRRGERFNYIVRDSRGNEIAKGAANLNAFGAFDFKFKLPDNMNLGAANVELNTNSSLGRSTALSQFSDSGISPTGI
jgi:uncharacterized protein YfaS (alpha-2-macroglobulin family)